MLPKWKSFWRNVTETLFSIIQTDFRFWLTLGTLQMESCLFDNGQIKERSRFPCVESLNCAHGKYLHFKGAFACLHNVWHRCTSWSWLGIGISTRREYSLCACVKPIPHSYCIMMSYSRLKQVHTRLTAREPTVKLRSSAMHYRTPSALTVKWIFLESREQRELFELLNKQMNCC